MSTGVWDVSSLDQLKCAIIYNLTGLSGNPPQQQSLMTPLHLLSSRLSLTQKLTLCQITFPPCNFTPQTSSLIATRIPREIQCQFRTGLCNIGSHWLFVYWLQVVIQIGPFCWNEVLADVVTQRDRAQSISIPRGELQSPKLHCLHGKSSLLFFLFKKFKNIRLVSLQNSLH